MPWLSSTAHTVCASTPAVHPQAVKATARFFHRGGPAGELSPEDASRLLAATGIDLRGNAAASAALQRLLKRPGGFTDPAGGDDRAALAAAGIPVAGRAATEKLTALFKRPGGFGELSDEEAARLALAGVDVHEPTAAKALSRAFKRSGGRWSDLSSEDKGRLVNAGIDVDNPNVSHAMAKLFKRPGGFSDAGDTPEDRAATAAAAGFVPIAKESKAAQLQRAFKRGAGGDDGIEEEAMSPGRRVAPESPADSGSTSLAERHQQDRFFKRGNQAYDGPNEDGGETHVQVCVMFDPCSVISGCVAGLVGTYHWLRCGRKRCCCGSECPICRRRAAAAARRQPGSGGGVPPAAHDAARRPRAAVRRRHDRAGGGDAAARGGHEAQGPAGEADACQVRRPPKPSDTRTF